MSSSGVEVKQQLFCILNILIKNWKGTCFLLFPPESPSNMRTLNTKHLGEIQMVEEHKIFFLRLLTPEKSNDR